MKIPDDSRGSKRVPIANRIKVETRGRVASFALAVNIGMGGLLISAAPSLPVGSSCKLAILPSDEEDWVMLLLEGTVVRSDIRGTAVQFSRTIEKNLFAELCG